MSLHPVTNFAKVLPSGTYAAGVTTITLSTGYGSKLPTTFPFPLIWWDDTTYPGTPEDDPNVEIVLVTNRVGDVLTVTRGQEGTSDVNHSTVGKSYRMALTLTKAMWDNIASQVFSRRQDFRLSLTAATPVTTADVSGASAVTIRAVPYLGKYIDLYNGSAWVRDSSAEFTIAVPAVANQVYDVFVYDNATVPTLELTAWTNDTTRATALAYQDGILVKSGAPTRRYLGTFRTAASGQTEDSLAKRYLWNYYHQKARPMKVVEATNSWTYTLATFRQANAATANQLDYVMGLNENPVEAWVHAKVGSSTTVSVSSGIGVDSTSVNSALVFGTDLNSASAKQSPAYYHGYPGIGRHTLVWLEYSVAAGTTTWYGDNGTTILQSGITGIVWG